MLGNKMRMGEGRRPGESRMSGGWSVLFGWGGRERKREREEGSGDPPGEAVFVLEDVQGGREKCHFLGRQAIARRRRHEVGREVEGVRVHGDAVQRLGRLGSFRNKTANHWHSNPLTR